MNAHTTSAQRRGPQALGQVLGPGFDLESAEDLGPEPGQGTVIAWGTRRSFRGMAEDIARAVRRAFRWVEAVPPGGRGERAGGVVNGAVDGGAAAEAGGAFRCGPGEPEGRGGAPLGLAQVLEGARETDVLLLEADAVPARAGAAPGLRGGQAAREAGASEEVMVYVLGFPQGADPWEAAERLRRILGPEAAQPVPVQMPQGRGWLADRLAMVGAAVPRHPRFGVLGASGGSGTSTVALWLAARLIENGRQAAVIDVAPGSAGLDAWVSPEPAPGLRWQEIAAMPALPEPGQLAAGLPAPRGLPVLTSTLHEDRPGGGREAAVIRALASEAVQVVDLGRIAESAPAEVTSGERLLGWCSAAVLLVPFTLRGICQARRWLRAQPQSLPVVPVGVGPRLCDLSDAELGEAIGRPLAAVIPPHRSVPLAAEEGRLLEASYHRALRRPTARLAEAVLEAVPGGVVGGGGVPARASEFLDAEPMPLLGVGAASGAEPGSGRGSTAGPTPRRTGRVAARQFEGLRTQTVPRERLTGVRPS